MAEFAMEVFGLGLRAWSSFSGLVFGLLFRAWFSGLVFGLLFRAWFSGFFFGLLFRAWSSGFGLFFRSSVLILGLPVFFGRPFYRGVEIFPFGRVGLISSSRQALGTVPIWTIQTVVQRRVTRTQSTSLLQMMTIMRIAMTATAAVPMML